MSGRTWLITGCSTGIGRAIAGHVVALGDTVVVTARKPADIADIVDGKDNAIALALDVADPLEIVAVIAQAQARFGGIDILVNNAGYGYVASIEEGDEAAVKAMFDVNLFGAIRMAKAVLPGMRARRRGHIINISSLAGRIANPATGYYSMSKHALEAMGSALAREVAELGIRVTTIAAGMFRTDFSGRSLQTGGEGIADYAAGVHARIALVRSVDGRQQGDPVKLAEAVVTLADMAEPPIQLILGPDAYAAIGARMAEMLASMEEYRQLSHSTNFVA